VDYLFLLQPSAWWLRVPPKAQKVNVDNRIMQFKHFVIIYQENHSFDNLYGSWGTVNGEPVNGQANADPDHTTQVRQDNTAYQCLLQEDVNLTSPPLSATCTDTTFQSAFPNKPFGIGQFIPPAATTCPKPVGAFQPNGFLNGHGLPGGCTRDIVHRFYNEQYQINGGKQNRYVTGSDAAGLAMGYYDTKTLPIYTYLQSRSAPKFVIADSFFQGAFGGSFLNHQWLIAAATPVFGGALNDGSSNDLHSVVDSNGMPTSTPLYNNLVVSPFSPKDAQLTASCNPPSVRPVTPPGIVCGDYAVNTTQPYHQPFAPNTADARRLLPLTNPTIGDRLSDKRIDWAWYAGGWSNANGDIGAPGWTNGNGPACVDLNALSTAIFPNCPDVNFQFHHQPFNYYSNFTKGAAARTAHLRDEAEFIQAAQNGTLKPVSFVKPIGEENEHPGYTNETNGSQHLVDLIKAIVQGPNGNDTLIVVTYDEFGGQWDHVPPRPTVGEDKTRTQLMFGGPEPGFRPCSSRIASKSLASPTRTSTPLRSSRCSRSVSILLRWGLGRCEVCRLHFKPRRAKRPTRHLRASFGATRWLASREGPFVLICRPLLCAKPGDGRPDVIVAYLRLARPFVTW
jgi:phospholipase C